MIQIKILRPFSFLMIFLILLMQFISINNEAIADDNQNFKNDVNNQSNLNNSLNKQQKSDRQFIKGDGLIIDTFPDTTSFLHRTFSIDGNGMVEFPMIGKVNISEMTTKQLEDFLKSEFKSYLKSPNLIVKPVIRISVLGGIFRPGLYYVDYDNSLWSVIHKVGGTISEDGLKEMKLERNSEVVHGNLIPYLENGESLRNIGIKSGDQIWIPSPDRPTFWTHLGEVLPVATFVTSLFMIYLTYQQQILLARIR